MPEIWGNAFETYNKGEMKISENTLLSLTKAIKSLKLWKNLGCKLLKSANFSLKGEQIIKATVSELKYEDKAQ